jgi:hypothetical protein
VIRRADDHVLADLSRLPRPAPEGAHVERVRARCHGALARRRHDRDTDATGRQRGTLSGAAIGAFALLYLSVVIHGALAAAGLI